MRASTYTIGEFGALYRLSELAGSIAWVVAIVDNGLVEVLRRRIVIDLHYYIIFISTTNLASAVVDVHNLSNGAPALAGTLLEDTNRVLVTTVPTDITISIGFNPSQKPVTHKLLTCDSIQAV